MDDRDIFGMAIGIVILVALGAIAVVLHSVKKSARSVVVRERNEEETLGI